MIYFIEKPINNHMNWLWLTVIKFYFNFILIDYHSKFMLQKNLLYSYISYCLNNKKKTWYRHNYFILFVVYNCLKVLFWTFGKSSATTLLMVGRKSTQKGRSKAGSDFFLPFNLRSLSVNQKKNKNFACNLFAATSIQSKSAISIRACHVAHQYIF